MVIDRMQVLRVALGLLTDPDGDPNPEYDRAIVEMTAILLGVADASAVETMLRALR